MIYKSRRGFTYIEFLIVVLVFAFVSAVVVVVLNPAELLRRGRDARRLSQLAELNKAINLLQADQPNADLGNSLTVYVSIPGVPDIALEGLQGQSIITRCDNRLPSLPPGWSYHCVASDDLQRIDGGGWLPINFKLLSSGSPFSALPIDPVNTVDSGLYYSYVPGGSYVITATMESLKYLNGVAAVDGAYDSGKIELGTDLDLSAKSSGLKGYWKMENNFGDNSKNTHDGTPYGGMFFTAGKVGQAANLDGVNDYIQIPHSTDLNFSLFTVEVWVKPQNITNSIVIGSQETYGIGMNGEEESIGFHDSVSDSMQLASLSRPPAISAIRRSPRGGGGGGGGGASYAWGYSIGILNGRWQFSVGAGSSFATIAGNSVNNAWIHLVGTYDGTNIKFYNNGVLMNSVPNARFNRNNSEPLRFGSLNTSLSSFFSGLIDEVSIFNRVLTPQEILARYNATK